MQDYCNYNIKDPKSIILLSTHTMPQVDDEDDVILSKYLDASTTIEIDGNEKIADGFNAGFCQGAPCIGFAGSYWANNSIYNIAITSGGKTSYVSWGCISMPEHTSSKGFVDWYSSIFPIELVSCSFKPDQKKIKIRKDHGYDILLEHAKSLVKCSYVVGVVNSLPFNPYCKSYVHKVSHNGLVDIVLYWRDQGYSMRIQTIGRNIRESEKIALFLKDKYGH